MFILQLIKQFRKELACSSRYFKRLYAPKVKTMENEAMVEQPVYAPNENPNDKMKMYILINRSQLTMVQCGVQAAHAVADFMHEHGKTPATLEWITNHVTMIFLEANEYQINDMMTFYKTEGKKFAAFKEPDLDNLLTAVAFEPVSSDYGKIIFGKFKLLN